VGQRGHGSVGVEENGGADGDFAARKATGGGGASRAARAMRVRVPERSLPDVVTGSVVRRTLKMIGGDRPKGWTMGRKAGEWAAVLLSSLIGPVGCDCASAGLAGPDAGEASADATDIGPEAADEDGATDVADDAALDTPVEVVPPADIRCGNGVVDAGEECDDGNRLNGDGCDWLCRLGDGDDPPDLPPDPDAGHAEGDQPPTPVELGVESPELARAGSPGNRLPLVSDGSVYATVWPHWAAVGAERRVEGTFVRFDVAGRRLDAPWSYQLAPDGDVYTVPRADLAWRGSGYGLVWSGRAVIPESEGPGISFLALDTDGKPLGEPVELAATPSFANRLGVAWDGEGYGVVADMVSGPGALSTGIPNYDDV